MKSECCRIFIFHRNGTIRKSNQSIYNENSWNKTLAAFTTRHVTPKFMQIHEYFIAAFSREAQLPEDRLFHRVRCIDGDGKKLNIRL